MYVDIFPYKYFAVINEKFIVIYYKNDMHILSCLCNYTNLNICYLILKICLL